MMFNQAFAAQKENVCVYIYTHMYIYICMSPIPFGLMRLGFLSSIMKTQANFVYGTLIYTYTSRHGFTNYTLIFKIEIVIYYANNNIVCRLDLCYYIPSLDYVIPHA